MVCEKYGWTVDYAVWGVSYLNVMMMLSDASTYLSDTKKAKSGFKTPSVPKASSSMFKGNLKGFMGFMHKLKDGK